MTTGFHNAHIWFPAYVVGIWGESEFIVHGDVIPYFAQALRLIQARLRGWLYVRIHAALRSDEAEHFPDHSDQVNSESESQQIHSRASINGQYASGLNYERYSRLWFS